MQVNGLSGRALANVQPLSTTEPDARSLYGWSCLVLTFSLLLLLLLPTAAGGTTSVWLDSTGRPNATARDALRC